MHLNSRLNTRRCIWNSDTVEKPYLGVHQTGSRPVSQVIRKRIEEVFGWGKEVAGLRRMRLRGLARVGSAFTLRVAAYNLAQLPKLQGAGA